MKAILAVIAAIFISYVGYRAFSLTSDINDAQTTRLEKTLKQSGY